MAEIDGTGVWPVILLFLWFVSFDPSHRAGLGGPGAVTGFLESVISYFQVSWRMIVGKQNIRRRRRRTRRNAFLFLILLDLIGDIGDSSCLCEMLDMARCVELRVHFSVF